MTDFASYKELWQSIFGDDYRDKYKHKSGLSGGGGNYSFYDIHVKQNVVLLSEHRFLLASSVEFFKVPNNWFLVAKNKSSIARLGVDASFNTVIDNGWHGYLTLEIVNHSNVSVYLEEGQPILKVLAMPVMYPCEPYAGKYQNQPNYPVGAR